MFKIPKWEDDVPKSNVDFGKSNKALNKKRTPSESVNNSIHQEKSPVSPSVSVKTLKNKLKTQKKKKNTNSSQSKENVNRKFTPKNTSNLGKNKKKFKKPFSTTDPKIDSRIKNKQSNLNENSNNASGDVVSIKTKKPKKRKFNEEGLSDSKEQLHGMQNGNVLNSNTNAATKPKKKKPNDEEMAIEGSILFSKSSRKNKKKAVQGDKSEKMVSHKSKLDQKKEKFKQILQHETNRNKINISGNKLRERMLERLKSAQFRFLNEKLYTTSGSEAQKLFQSDPDAFQTYHEGYQQQVKKWPVNPLDLIVKRISKMPKTHLIADMGCGEAALSRRVQQTVRSFDLVASAPGVEACDMAHTPLLAEAMDAVVYCLALMGTDLTQCLVEANRVLKTGGHLLVAEVESRFDKVEKFVEEVQKLGFKLKNLDKTHKVFFFMEFVKIREPPAKKSKMPVISLKPCLYKRR